MNIYDLVSAIQRTEGYQCVSWKGELRDKVMEAAHSYADACVAIPFSSQAISGQQVNLDEVLRLVFMLIPESK